MIPMISSLYLMMANTASPKGPVSIASSSGQLSFTQFHAAAQPVQDGVAELPDEVCRRQHPSTAINPAMMPSTIQQPHGVGVHGRIQQPLGNRCGVLRNSQSKQLHPQQQQAGLISYDRNIGQPRFAAVDAAGRYSTAKLQPSQHASVGSIHQ